MDIAADTQAPVVEWARVAQTMMEQLSAEEQADVRASVDEAARGFDRSDFKPIASVRPGHPPFYVMQATPTLRVFFERTDDRVRVLDVVDAEQLAYFRDEAQTVAR